MDTREVTTEPAAAAADLFSGVADEALESTAAETTNSAMAPTSAPASIESDPTENEPTVTGATAETSDIQAVLVAESTPATTLGTTALQGQSDTLSEQLTTTLRTGNGPPASASTSGFDLAASPANEPARDRTYSADTNVFGSNSDNGPARAALNESWTLEIGVLKITATTSADFTQLQQLFGGTGVSLTFSGTIQIAGFVNLSGSFTITTPTAQSVTLATGLSDPHGSMGSVAVSAWSISANDVSAFVGVGGPHRLDTNNDGLINSADPLNPEAVGFAIDGLSIGLVIMKTVGGITNPQGGIPETHSFYGLKATASMAGLVGMTSFIEASAAVIAVNVNAGNPWFGSLVAPVVNFAISFPGSGGPVGFAVAGTSLYIDYAGPLLAASADRVLLRISDFVFVAGGLSISKGPTQYVDVRTGLTSAQADVVLAGVTTATSDPGGTTLRRSTDGSMLWNLPVETIDFGLSGVDVFVGYTDDLATPAADGDLTRAELESVNAIGVFLDEISLAMVIMRAVPDPALTTLSAARLRFFAIKIEAAAVELLGVPGLTLGATNLEVRLNQGSAIGWPTSVSGPPPVVDFGVSYSGGYSVRTSGSTTLAIRWSEPLVGFSAGRALLRVSDFVYVAGGLSFNKIGGAEVDVRTGLTSAAPLVAAIPTISATDPANGSLARTSDGSIIWNLPVDTIEFGLQSVDVFAGYTDSLDAAAADGNLTSQELRDAHAVGVFLDNVSLAMVVMRASSTAPAIAALQPRFFALRVDAGAFELLGIPEFDLSAATLQFRVNQGSATWAASPTAIRPVVDFELSFGSGGYPVQTSTSTYLPLPWTQPLIGVSADRVLLRISDFVYVSGGFSFNKGPVEKVDVRTNLTSAQAGPVLGSLMTTGASATDPGATLAAKSDGSIIWNLPVETLEFGLSNVDVFVGYTNRDSNALRTAAQSTGELSLADLTAADAIGVFLDEASLGLVLMRALPVAQSALGTGTLNTALLRFFALQADASLITLVGIDALDLSVSNLQVRVNQGSFAPGVWPAVPGVTPPPVIDFALSYPDNYYGSDTGTEPDGYRVQTNTTGGYKAIIWDTPVIGVSADRVLLRISDFVYVSGGFSFNKGPVEKVDVRTNLTSTQAAPVLGTLMAPGHASATDPGTTLAAKSDGSIIWNLPVETLDFGLSNVDVFVGYTNHDSNALRTAALDTGELTLANLTAADAIGVFLDEASLGLVVMRALPVSPTALGTGTLNTALLRFFALQGDAALVSLVGIDALDLSVSNLQVRLNQGSFAPAVWPAVPGITPPPIVDFALSYPDNYHGSDADTLPDGYHVQTNTSGGFKALVFDTPVIGVSADRVLLRISDFVYVSGGFSFNKGPVEKVDVRTNLTQEQALPVLGALMLTGASATDPGTTLAAKSDGSIIWNLPVETLDFGLSDVDVFVGYTSRDSNVLRTAALATGELTLANLTDADAIGVFLDEASLGLVVMRALPVNQTALGPGTLNTALLRFFALQGDASLISLVGINALDLSVTNLQVRLNQGSFAPGIWPAVPGITPPPVVDFALSYPDNYYGTDTDVLSDGYRVQTNTSGAYKAIVSDTPLIGASADRVLLRISEFVYVSGGFSFNKGPVKNVDVRTGLSSFQAAPVLGALMATGSNTDPGTLGAKSDGSMIWNLPVETIDFGLSNVDVFAGYTDPSSTALRTAAQTTGELTMADLTAAKAIGVFLDEVNLGLVVMRALPVSQVSLGTGTLNAAMLKFFALQGSAANLGLVGVPEIQLLAQGAEVRVNQGSFAPGIWPAVTGITPPPVVDFLQSFPDNSWNGVDDGTAADGYRVATNTTGGYIPLLFDQPLIAGGAEKVTIQISQFVYITGSIYFEKGPVISAPLAAGLAGDPSSLGIPPEYVGMGNKQVQTMTIGATNVNAFVGLRGPYWMDSTSGPYANGLIDRDGNGNIIAAEVNSSATGLVIDNLNFGLFIGTPTNALDPMRYVALRASAQQVALVGIDHITASASGIYVELNLSSPTVYGFPVLPVINFSGLPGGNFGVKTGAKDGSGDDITIDLAMNGPLIRAQGFINLNVYGSVYLSGSIAFELGPTQTVTLSNSGGTKTVTTMSIGVANVNAFIGANGPYWTDTNGNHSVDTGELSTTAVGFSIVDLDAGLLVMASTAPADIGAWVAMKATVNSFGLVNMPSSIVATGTFDIAINVGPGIWAVDFVTSFPATTNPVAPAGYRVNTGDPTSPVLLNFTGPQVTIQLGGHISIASMFDLSGVFLFDMNLGGLKLYANASLTIGPAGDFFSFAATGVLVINGNGIAADVDLAMTLGAGISDVALSNVTARLILNTSGVEQSVTIPQKFLSMLSAAALARLSDGPGGTKLYTVSASAPRLDGTTAPAGTYLVVRFGATLRILGFDFVGNFQMVADPQQFQLTANATLNLSIGGTTIFSFHVGGDLLINNSGKIAAGIDLALTEGFTMPSGLGLSLGVSYQLRLNTGPNVTLPSVGLIETGFRVRATGTLSVPGLTLSGYFDITVATDRFTFKINATVSIFGATLTVDGFAGLYYDSHPGFAFSIRLKVGGSEDVTVSPLAGSFSIRGTFLLSINTSGAEREGIAAQTFQIGVTNLEVNLFGFKLTGTLVIGISPAGLSIDIPAPGITLDFFHIITLNVSGYLHTDGSFSFTASATIRFLDPDIFGFEGSISVSFSNTGFGGSLSGTFGAFGIKVSAGGSFYVESGIVKIDVFISFQLIPAFSFKIWTPWKTYTVHVPALVISGHWRYTFGALSYAPVIPPPPVLATKDGTTLRLNIGVDAHYRGANYPAADESYTLTRIDADTIRVSALGYSQDFTGITNIVANDTQSYNTFISIAPEITATVAINVGKTVSGSNHFILGGGSATVHGGSNHDWVEFGTGGGTYVGKTGDSRIRDKSNGGLTVYAPGFESYVLEDGSLTYGNADGTVVHVMTFDMTYVSGVLVDRVRHVILNGASNAVYETSSLPDPSDGIATPWTGSATFNGAGASSTVRSSTATNLTLTNAGLTESGVTITLSNITIAELFGNDSANTFTVSGWGYNGTITGRGGVDTVVATNDRNFTLSDTSLARSAWGTFTLAGIEIATLTGGAGANTFAVSNWSGTANLDGAGGADTYQATFVGSGSGVVNITDTGASGTDAVIVNGTAAADAFVITGTQVTRASEVVNYAGAESLTVNGLAGADTFVVNSTSVPTTLNGGADNDGFTVNATTATLTLSGDDGADDFLVNAAAAALTLNGGAGDDAFRIRALSADSTINTGTGVNRIDVGSADYPAVGNVNAIAGKLTISGGGTDSLYVNDTGDSTANTGQLTSNRLTGLGMGDDSKGIDYTSIETLVVALGSGGNTFNVRSTNAGTTTELQTGSGSATVNVGSSAPAGGGNANGMGGRLNVIGQGTNDILNVDDAGDATANTGLLTSTRLTGLGMGTSADGIGYTTVEFLNVSLGTGGNTFNIQSTHADTLTTLNTGAGSANVVNLGSLAPATNGNVDAIVGKLIVNGQAESDTINLDDTGDATANTGELTATRLTGLGMGDATKGLQYASIEFLNINLGTGGDTLNVLSTNAGTLTTIATGTGAAANVVNLGSLAPATGGNVNAIAGKLVVNGQGSADTVNVDDRGDSAANTGLLTATRLTGLGMAGDDVAKGIEYSGVETLNISLGSGGDNFTIQSTHVGVTVLNTMAGDDHVAVNATSGATTINSGDGNDTLNIGSSAAVTTNSGGTLNAIQGALTIDGGADTDTVNLDETGDAGVNSGTLSSTQLLGFGMGASGITYASFEAFNLNLGSGNDTLTVLSTHAFPTRIEGRAGNDQFTIRTIAARTEILGQDGSDTFTVGDSSLGAYSTVNGIQALLVLNGGTQTDVTDVLNVTELDEAASASLPGTLTSTFLSGLGMASSGGVDYREFEQLGITLGQGADTFFIASTHAGLTTLYGGAGADQVFIATVTGETRIRGEAGDDTIKVNVDSAGAERQIGGVTQNGVGALLDLDGQAGSDSCIIYLAGAPYSSSYPVSLINVHDSGATGTNTLDIYGADVAAVSDNFLIRRNFVALMPTVAGGATPTAERVNYDGTLTGGVTIYGRAGNDYFAFDDTSATFTVDGGGGNDIFQVGQMFQSERVTPNVAGGDETTTVHTTRGFLTPGVHFATTIRGGDGNDQFTIFSNQGPLSLFGNDGDDSFVVRAFALYGSEATDPARAGTSISAGLGADYVEYNVNAPVTLDGGDGSDKVVIVGTEFSDHFVITATGVTGTGLSVTFTNIELLEVDGMEGNDRFTVLSTPAGVVTRLFGGLGSDTFEVGGEATTTTGRTVQNVGGPLIIEGGTDPSANRSLNQPLLYLGETNPSQHESQSNPNLTAIEADQVDSLWVYNNDVLAAQSGTLAHSLLSGLGMGPAAVLSGQTYPSGITYLNLEMVSVYLGRGDDTFEIQSTHGGSALVHGGEGGDTIQVRTVLGHTSVLGGAGDDQITLGAGASALTIDRLRALVTVDGGGGNDTVTIDDRADTSNNLGTLDTHTLTGLDLLDACVRTLQLSSDLAINVTLTITIDGHTTSALTVGANSAEIRAALMALGLPDVSDIVVNRAGNFFTFSFLVDENLSAALNLSATVSGTLVAGATDVPNRVQTITLPANSGTFTVNIASGQSFTITAGDSENTVRDAIIAKLPSEVSVKDVVVAKFGNSYEVGFQGLLSRNRGNAYTFAATIPVESRNAGVNYYDVDTLNLQLGSGSDVLNIRGTSAFTNVCANDGDDRVYVSSLASETLTSETDFLLGNLDRILGTLNLDLGAGRHTLMISDESATVGDGTTANPVCITDQPVAGLGLPATEITITGLTPAPAITYKAAPTGNFADGITIWTGWGADFISIDGTHQRGDGAIGSMRTITTLNTGLGDDNITVNLNASDGFFVLNTQGPYNTSTSVSDKDTVNAAGSTRPLIIFGGQDNDNLTGGQAADLIFGDRGLVTYYDGASAATVLGNGGPGDRTDGIERTVGRIETTHSAVGGNDEVYGLDGADFLFGGTGGDRLDAAGTDAATDVVVGDNGTATFTNGILRSLETSASESGGDDHIFTGNGSDFVLGGSGNDEIDTGTEARGDTSRDVVIGDNGRIDFDATGTLTSVATAVPATGGNDTIRLGGGNNMALGGAGNDDITAGSGADVVIGDGGSVTAGAAGLIAIETDTSALGGTDTVHAGAGGDFIIGGVAGDTLHGEADNDLIFGDNARITFTSGVLASATTLDTSVGAADTVWAGAGNDVVIGGVGGDTLNGEAGDDLIFGDDAEITFASGAVVSAEAIDPTVGGADTIDGGSDNDAVIAGAAGDTVRGGTGNDVVFGDFGTLTFAGGVLVRAETTHNQYGGADTLRGQDGQDVLVGGAYGDQIDGGSGDDLITGDNALLDRTGRVGNFTSPLYQALTGTLVYDNFGNALISGTPSSQPGTSPAWADFVLTLVDHSATEQAVPDSTKFGNDTIAGGAGNDRIFGGLGNDTIQGDGSIDRAVSASRTTGGVLQVTGALEDLTDGDDYIEGNGGNDLIFGGLGQDDIIGGSSNLFGLTTGALRPDGTDLIFGGAGTDLAREDAGDTSATGRARDADTILGDNGDIYRLVGTNGVAGGYLTFGYDNYGPLAIVPRAAKLLDYTLGGADLNPASAALDIGAADEIHGESGNDTIYGQLGDDVLFGEGQDDDIIGGTGADWISGGNGDDGVLGDDGRIFTSRNGTAEPLYGMPAIPEGGLNDEISTPGDMQLAIINVSGALKKTAILEPFELATTPTVAGTTPSNDIIFGGLGDDFLHGGPGDDAISGAEAVPDYYAKPFNPGNILGFGKYRPGEFAAYDEYNPLAKIYVNLTTFEFTAATTPGAVPFILNFVSTEPDGNDVIFGDVGNDWAVGGMGRDHLYGGYGDDLLNGDDNQDTAGGLNNVADGPAANMEDLAFGGAGRDIMIGNTGGDRLIDWAGEFNSYIVPFSPFGAAAISRAVQPGLMDFLYDLSASDGADPTRAAKTGSAAARHGEPEGELGLVKQSDFDWGTQTGAPADPQPGNIPGGRRDVLRTANFNNGTADGFSPDSGVWQVAQGRLQVSPSVIGSDAVSVFYVDAVLPRYYEVQATINAVKPTGGYKANGYMIFDYQSPTDFKFAGIDIATDKLVIGHRDASGWIVDTQANMQIKADQDYNMLLAVNGVTATLVVNNSNVLSFAFAPRVIDGYSYNLNTGMTGVGGDNSRVQIDNVTVQVLPPTITFQETETFADGFANLLKGAQVGQWLVGGGRDVGTVGANGYAASNFNLGLSANSLLQIETTLSAGAAGTSAGVVFDYYDAQNFKFAAIVAGTNQVVIGHHMKNSWVIDASVSRAINAGTDYLLSVSLKGTTISVSVGGQAALGFAFNAVVTDGQAGLFTRGGASSFDGYLVKTDDPKFLGTVIASSSDPVAATGGTMLSVLAASGVTGTSSEQGVSVTATGSAGSSLLRIDELAGPETLWPLDRDPTRESGI